MALESILAQLGRNPSTVAACFDFDGTLSEIKDDPDGVQPVPGVVDDLVELASRIGVVAIVSGRPVSFLERFFSDDNIQLSGLYGIEHRSGGELQVHPDASQWLPAISRAVEEARAEFGAEAVEDKGYSVTVHYRRESEEFGERVLAWAERVAEDTGLEDRGAKQSIELHPPIVRSKGDAVEDMLGGISAASYFGDDLGDLPAFERLATLTKNGALETSARVVVAGPETPDQMHTHATNVLEGPTKARAAIAQMIEALPTL